MLWKLLGTVMLTLGGMTAALRMNERLSAMLRQNFGLISLLRRIKGEIDCFSAPISDILKECGGEIFRSCSYEGKEAPKSLQDFLAQCRCYDEESMAIFSRFSEEFGRNYREEQVRACAYYLERLEERRGILAMEIPLKKKRNATLCVCASLALSLLLI